MNRNKELQALNDVLEGIQVYETAFKLLEEVYAELGPYACVKDKISQELQRKLNNFFKFNDSE